jgi:hypothetical protein
MVSLLLDHDLRILPSIHLFLQSIRVALILNRYDWVDDGLVALEGRSLRFLQKLARSMTLVQNQRVLLSIITVLGIITLLVDVLVDNVELLWTDEEVGLGCMVSTRAIFVCVRRCLFLASL